MRVRVLAFARVREVLGAGAYDLDLPVGSTAADAWNTLAQNAFDLRALSESTRVARNGRIVSLAEPLQDGDELALLPPVGGG